MNRRAFVRRAATAASSLLLGALHARRAATAQCMQRAAGVQLYALREFLQRDAAAALAALSALALEEVELFGLSGTDNPQLFGMSAGEFKDLLDRNGLKLPISQIDDTLTNTAALSDLAHQLGLAALVVALPTEFTETRDSRIAMVPAKSIEQLDRLAERLNRAGREFRMHGLTFGYHNHHVEFIPVEGRIPFDYLMANTDPALVKIELDLGWLAVASVDLIEYLARYRGRVIACHMKDFAPGPADVRGTADTRPVETRLVEPGAGVVDFPRVLDAMDATGVPHAFIEIDVSDDPLAAIERGHRYLQRLRAC
jgi:sugar phosphate isomerase/epimerase